MKASFVDASLQQIAVEALIDWLSGPTYTDFEVYDLSVMQPYSLQTLHDSFYSLSKDVVLYLPRTSDLRQIAKYAKEDEELEVKHYCMHGASKAICVFFGSFDLD